MISVPPTIPTRSRRPTRPVAGGFSLREAGFIGEEGLVASKDLRQPSLQTIRDNRPRLYEVNTYLPEAKPIPRDSSQPEVQAVAGGVDAIRANILGSARSASFKSGG